ncbi:hypothetical protein G7074_19160 [Pedobacter sp. HDW13]|uniref:hypothetical protein n=1 Tax=Pedobacter sp. HDW13 TaxID=2714940 RepID=UPI00140A0ECD|nr:hypothetical protein [Pedobacter sp. HDW13]QIL41198.1 hypothetical protein G7074_19160 [Pedobacter sp. HDW13]
MNEFYEYTYFLDGISICILEAKFTEQVSKAAKYQWLLIYKNPLKITPLTFHAMDSSGKIEERFFDLGYLKFDSEKGIFIKKNNKAQHNLLNTKQDNLPEEMRRASLAYFNKFHIENH